MHTRLNKIQYAALLGVFMLGMMPATTFAAVAKTRATENIFTNANSPIIGSAAVSVAVSAYKTKVLNNEVFKSPYQYTQVSQFTVVGQLRPETKGNGAAHACALIIYTDKTSVARCQPIAASVTKLTNIRLVVPVLVKKQVAFAQFYIKAASKKEARFIVEKISGTFIVPATAPLAVTPAPAPLPVTPAPAPEPTPVVQPDPTPSPVTTPTPPAPTLAGAAPAATVLRSGLVFFVGGTNNGTLTDAAVVYDPNAKTFSTPLYSGHFGTPFLTTFPDGSVLITGGFTNAEGTEPNLKITRYSSIYQTFSDYGVALVHAPLSATLLPTGNVLLLEGASSCDSMGQTTKYIAQLYKPLSPTLTTANLTGGTSATAMGNGSVLVRGFNGCVANTVTGGYTTGFSNVVQMYNPGPDSYNGTTASYAYPNAGQQAPEPRRGIVLASGKIFYADYGKSTGVTAFQIYKPSDATFVADVQTLGYDPGVPVYENAAGKILLANVLENKFYWYDSVAKTISATTPTGIVYQGYAPALVAENGQIIAITP